MGLVDDDQTDTGHELGELAGEAGVGEALGGDQQHIECVAVDGVEDGVPLVGVGGVDGGGAQAGAGGGLDLVVHEGKQRGDDKRGAAAGGSQRRGGRPVHRRLSPPGGLHDEHSGGRGDDRSDGLELVGSWRSALAGEPVQHGGEVQLGVGGGGGGHG